MSDTPNLKTLEGVREALAAEQDRKNQLIVERQQVTAEQSEQLQLVSLQNELLRVRGEVAAEEQALEVQKEGNQVASELPLTKQGTIPKDAKNVQYGYDFTGNLGYVPVDQLPEGQPPVADENEAKEAAKAVASGQTTVPTQNLEGNNKEEGK